VDEARVLGVLLRCVDKFPFLRTSSDSGPSKILQESRDILAWLCEVQPELIPDEHRGTIKSLLEAFFCLSRQAVDCEA
jgi:hypothetical protein